MTINLKEMSLTVKEMSPCQIKVPFFFRHNHDPRDIYLQEGLLCVSLFDHVYGL